jgi:hypothetical protein
VPCVDIVAIAGTHVLTDVASGQFAIAANQSLRVLITHLAFDEEIRQASGG